MSLAVLPAVAVTVVAALKQPSITDAVVEEHYPSSRLKPQRGSDRRHCFQVLERDAAGAPLRIIAAYTDRARGVVRLLTRGGNGEFTVTYESPVSPYISGNGCEITLRDVDGDGERDVFLQLTVGRYSRGWIFRWVSGTLTNVTPLRNGGGLSTSALTEPVLLDVRHDGTLQIAAGGDLDPRREEDRRLLSSPSMFRFVGGTYQLDRPVLLAEQFNVRDPASLGRVEFSLTTVADGPYVLRVVNGGSRGVHRVTGGTVTLNGVTLTAPGHINEQVEFLDVPLGSSLPVDNVVEVQLQGSSDAFVTVLVEETDARLRRPFVQDLPVAEGDVAVFRAVVRAGLIPEVAVGDAHVGLPGRTVESRTDVPAPAVVSPTLRVCPAPNDDVGCVPESSMYSIRVNGVARVEELDALIAASTRPRTVPAHLILTVPHDRVFRGVRSWSDVWSSSPSGGKLPECVQFTAPAYTNGAVVIYAQRIWNGRVYGWFVRLRADGGQWRVDRKTIVWASHPGA
jgi:hypothetical protein